jgi:hypothetical protein
MTDAKLCSRDEEQAFLLMQQHAWMQQDYGLMLRLWQ